MEYKEHLDTTSSEIVKSTPSPKPMQQHFRAGMRHQDQQKCPPDLKLAWEHGMANKVGKSELDGQREKGIWPTHKINLCDCCGLAINSEELPKCAPVSDLVFLGPGIPLFFQFIKACIILLTIIFCGSGIQLSISNYGGTDCLEINQLNQTLPYQCEATFVNRLSIANQVSNTKRLQIQGWVNFGSAFVFFIGLLILRYWQRKIENECDVGLVSASDFTLMISNLPRNKYVKEDIINLLKKQWESFPKSEKEESEGFPIAYLSLAQSIQNQEDSEKEKIKLINEKTETQKKMENIKAIQAKNEKDKTKDENKINNLQSKLDEIDKNLNTISEFQEHVENECWEGIKKETAGVVFAIFHSNKKMEQMLERSKLSSIKHAWIKFTRNFCCQSQPPDVLHYNDEILYIEPAKEPDDIIWENLKYPNSQRFK